MIAWLADLRFALRVLARRPVFMLVGGLTLAVGICATTTVFSVVDTVLLRPLPYGEAEELYVVRNQERESGRLAGAAWPEFLAWQEGAGDAFTLATWVDRPYNVTGGSEPVQVWSSQVSGGFFDLLRVEPRLGRAFTAAEESAGGPPAVVVSHGFWSRWLGADAEAVGRRIYLDDEPHRVVGVMPESFRSPTAPVEMWVSLERIRDDLPQGYGLKFFNVVGRPAPEVGQTAALERLAVVGRRLAGEQPQSNAGLEPALVPMRRQLLGDVRTPLLVLLVAGAFVLLIACLNVANLLLARAHSRRREFAVRHALGVSRGRLLRQLLTENALFAAAGGIGALGLSGLVIRFLPAVLPADLLPPGSRLGLDLPVLALATGIVVLVAFVFGLVPLARARRSAGGAVLGGGAVRSSSGGGNVSRRLRGALVVAEVALALVLLVAASLLFASLDRLQDQELGFEPRGVLSLYLLMPEARYPESEDAKAFVDRVQGRLAALPGAESVGLVTHLPISNNDISEEIRVEGRAPARGETHRAGYRAVSGEYFQAMRIPLRRGRLFDRVDQDAGRRVVVINESLAQRHFPDRDPLGQRLGLQGMMPETEGFGETSWYEIVGVVANVRHRSVDTAPRAEVYLPYLRMPWTVFYLVVRTDGDPLAAADSVRRAIWSVDPDLPVSDLKTMSQRVGEEVAQPRFNSILLGAFSAVALLLAAVGVFGVVAFLAGERTQEIGVRMSLGANRGSILRLLLGDGLRLALGGVALGLLASFLLMQLLEGMLYGVSALDPVHHLTVAAVLTAVALAACWWPARRASRLDPLTALREP